jgi:hypothetical protein
MRDVIFSRKAVSPLHLICYSTRISRELPPKSMTCTKSYVAPPFFYPRPIIYPAISSIAAPRKPDLQVLTVSAMSIRVTSLYKYGGGQAGGLETMLLDMLLYDPPVIPALYLYPQGCLLSNRSRDCHAACRNIAQVMGNAET